MLDRQAVVLERDGFEGYLKLRTRIFEEAR